MNHWANWLPETRECICGRYHAPWWGRYVKAPSCHVSDSALFRKVFGRR